MLSGFTVGITADRRWDEQAALFERRGATVMHGPSIRTLPLRSDQPLLDATTRIIERPPDMVIANTGLGVRSWFGAADSWGLGPQLHRALAASRIIARGPKASGAVHSLGLEVEARADNERLSEAIDLVLARITPGGTVAVQLDGSGTAPDVARLDAAGVTVIAVPVYEWTMPDDDRPALKLIRALIAGRVHAVTFTTGPSVRNFVAIAAEHDLDQALTDTLRDPRLVVGCVGPVCAEKAAALGLPREQLVVPTAYRLGPMVRAVADELVRRLVSIDIGGVRMVLAGSTAVVDDVRIDLSDAEARLLGVLASHPNSVFTKAELLVEAWAGTGADEHVVEVTVARLRRRLGAHGTAITSIHRRGYTLRS